MTQLWARQQGTHIYHLAERVEGGTTLKRIDCVVSGPRSFSPWLWPQEPPAEKQCPTCAMKRSTGARAPGAGLRAITRTAEGVRE